MEDANGQESQQHRGMGEVSIDMGSLSASEAKILADDGDEDSSPLVITRRRVGRGVRLPVHLVVVCSACVSIPHVMVYKYMLYHLQEGSIPYVVVQCCVKDPLHCDCTTWYLLLLDTS